MAGISVPGDRRRRRRRCRRRRRNPDPALCLTRVPSLLCSPPRVRCDASVCACVLLEVFFLLSFSFFPVWWLLNLGGPPHERSAYLG